MLPADRMRTLKRKVCVRCLVRESQPSNVLALGVKQARWDHNKSEAVQGEPSDRYQSSVATYGCDLLIQRPAPRRARFRQDTALTPQKITSLLTHFSPKKATNQTGNHYPFGALGRLFTVITSTSHSQARPIQGNTNVAWRHRQEDFHGQPDGPLPASRNQNPPSKYAAADSLPRNPTGAETHPPVQDTKRDQQSYPPGTQRVRRSADRIYYLDRDDKVIHSVLVTATRHEARPNHGSPATEALTDQFGSMNIQSNISGQGGSYQTIRHSNALSASTEKAREDAWVSSRHASAPRELPQSAGDNSTNLYARHETPRRTSPEANIGMRDERRQSRERPHVTYPQDDNEDDYGETSSLKSAQDQRRPLPPQQPEYGQYNDQSQRQPKRQVMEDSTVQSHTITNHGRRSSTSQWPDLPIINEGRELRMTRTAESNRSRDEVLDRRGFPRRKNEAILTKI